ncbi:UDP-glycosyltransferase 89B2 [Iris pallida]|uniref:UDP-glycosyltransferase 89B2 n=1 Tax=Iris pallida TaxID=29817 RepID=A0AAX6FCP8_IRIPA|nr:UDP-glycosyltransferase 89B2 [Iris pallida]
MESPKEEEEEEESPCPHNSIPGPRPPPPLLDLARHLSTVDALTITVAATPKNLPCSLRSSPPAPPSSPSSSPSPPTPPSPRASRTPRTSPLPPLLPPLHGQLRQPPLPPPPLGHVPQPSPPPTSIISDFSFGWTNGLAKELGVPRLTFSPSAAFTLSIARETWATMLRPPPGAAEDEAAAYVMSFPTLPGSPSFPWREMSPLYRAHEEGEAVSEAVRNGFVANMESWGLVFNTFRGLEGEYVDHLRGLLGHERVWAVGPVSALVGGSSEDRGGASSVPVAELMDWLDERESGSVLYVCFGTQVVLSQAQTAAVATALERSGVHFVWSIKTGPATTGAGAPGRVRGEDQREGAGDQGMGAAGAGAEPRVRGVVRDALRVELDPGGGRRGGGDADVADEGGPVLQCEAAGGEGDREESLRGGRLGARSGRAGSGHEGLGLR